MNALNSAFIVIISILIICLSGCINQGIPPNTVDIRDSSFHPATITVNAGTTITWSNHDDTDESVTATDGSFDSGNISTGYEYRHTFLQPGTYTYYSKAHPSMRGEVVVSSTSAYPNATSNATGGGQRAMNATGSTTIDLVAKNIAFDKKTITVPAGVKITINFDNQDSGVPHNFAVYETSSAQKTIFKGEIITGPSKTAYTFNAPDKPGTYFFRCDVHPNQMTGQFVVTSSGAQPVSAQAGAPSENATGSNASRPGPTSGKNISAIGSSNMTKSNATASKDTMLNATTSNATTSNTTISNVTTSNVTTSNVTTSNVTTSNVTTSNVTTSNVTTPNASRQNATSAVISRSNLVEIDRYAYNPPAITVPAGTTVVWINLDPVTHTVTSAEGKFDSGNLTHGESYSNTFKDPGSYSYYCTIHPYMKGKVIAI